MIYRIFALFLVTVSLAACAFQKPSQMLVEEVSIDRNAKLIEQQQLVLQEQSERLDELAAFQQELGTTLKDMQQTLVQVQELATYDAAGVPVPSKVLEALPAVERETRDRKDRVAEPQPTRNGVEKMVVGRNEWVWVDLLNQVLKARIDTGVLISSISARNIQPFERNGEKWVSFSLAGDESDKVYETPLVRHVKVKSAPDKDRLAVISLTVQLGDLIEETEFTLTDKDSAVYPVLLGRAFLRDIAMVDVSRKFVHSKKQLMDRLQTSNQTVQQ